MIHGTVTASREAVVHLQVAGSSGLTEGVDAVVVSGFTDWLTLPSQTLVRLGCTWYKSDAATLGDGSVVPVDIYKALAMWDGDWRNVEVVEAGGSPLVGMAMLYGQRVTLDVVDGGDVAIEQIPP